jgi:hypothetical protein
MRKRLFELTDIKLFLDECKDRLKRSNYADIGLFMDTVRYLVLITHYCDYLYHKGFKEFHPDYVLVKTLNKYLNGNWKTETYPDEEDFFVALNRELMDILDEVGTRAYEEKHKEEPNPNMPKGRVVFKTEGENEG